MVFCKRILIIFTIFLLLIGISSFSWGVTSVPFYQLDKLYETGGQLIYAPSSVGFYFPVVSGHTYKIIFNNSNNMRTVFTTEVPSEGVSAYDFTSSVDSVFEITVPVGTSYLYCYNYTYGGFTYLPVEVQDVTNGLYSVSLDLVDNVGLSLFWQPFEISIAFLSVVVVCVFGFYIIIKLIKKLSKGKRASL